MSDSSGGAREPHDRAAPTAARHGLAVVIVRTSEARVRPGREDEFLRRLRDLVAGFPIRHAGLLGHEVLVDRDDPGRVVYLSRWRDETAVEGFAGPDWASAPVTFPGEAELLTSPLAIRHFVVDDGV